MNRLFLLSFNLCSFLIAPTFKQPLSLPPVPPCQCEGGADCGKTKEGGHSQKKYGKASGRAPEIRPKHRNSLPNGRQQEPQGGGAKRRPLGAAPKAPPCCLPFGKDFPCFRLISGAYPEAFPPSFFWDCPPSLVFPSICRRFLTGKAACWGP